MDLEEKFFKTNDKGTLGNVSQKKLIYILPIDTVTRKSSSVSLKNVSMNLISLIVMSLN